MPQRERPQALDRLAQAVRQRERAEKKSAAANRENDRLRQEVRKLRLQNYTQQVYLGNPASQAGYMVRYEKLHEAVAHAVDMLQPVLNGLPDEAPQTLEPARPPAWARVEFEKAEQRGA